MEGSMAKTIMVKMNANLARRLATQAELEANEPFAPQRIENPNAKGAMGISRKRWWKALRATYPPFLDGSPARVAFRQFYLEQERTGAGDLAGKLGISRARLLRGTKGLPFRRDFGVDAKGRSLAVFFDVATLQWALGEHRALVFTPKAA